MFHHSNPCVLEKVISIWVVSGQSSTEGVEIGFVAIYQNIHQTRLAAPAPLYDLAVLEHSYPLIERIRLKFPAVHAFFYL
jgi:hypothetical protein